MNNWMEKFERNKEEQRERELNTKLEKLLNLLDETCRDKDRVKVLEEIIKVYDELKIDACDYNEKDYMDKKKELAEIRYEMKRQEHMEQLEAQSWEEYKEEEQKEDREDDEERE